MLADAHIHLDFMSNAANVLREAGALDLAFFATTVTPAGYEHLRDTCAHNPRVHLGAGLHPWWVADGRAGADDLARTCDLIAQTRWVGEVGLDFSSKHTAPESRDLQLTAFTTLMRACAQAEGRIVSIHSVRAAACVLDVLEDTGCLASCRCIFHWFSGSTDELWRAIRAGCWFSINERQASTRRAREQLKLIPRDRLLLETDLPPQENAPFSAADIKSSLLQALRLTERIRGEELLDAIARNWEQLAL